MLEGDGMKVLLMIAWLLLATNVYAGQTKDADNSSVQSEASKASEALKPSEAPNPVPNWAGANSEPSLSDDDSVEPSEYNNEEPSFQPDTR